MSDFINWGPISRANRTLSHINKKLQNLDKLDENSLKTIEEIAKQNFEVIHEAEEKITSGKNTKPDHSTTFVKSLSSCHKTLEALSKSSSGALKPYLVKSFLSLPGAFLAQNLDNESSAYYSTKQLSEDEKTETASLSSSSSKDPLDSFIIPGIDNLPVNNEPQKRLKDFITQHSDKITEGILTSNEDKEDEIVLGETASLETTSETAPQPSTENIKERFFAFFSRLYKKSSQEVPEETTETAEGVNTESINIEMDETPFIDVQNPGEKSFHEKLSQLSSHILENGNFHKTFSFQDIQEKRKELLGFDPEKGSSSFSFVEGQLGLPSIDQEILLAKKEIENIEQEIERTQKSAISNIRKDKNHMKKLEKRLAEIQEFREKAKSFRQKLPSPEPTLDKLIEEAAKRESSRKIETLNTDLKTKETHYQQIIEKKNQAEQNCLTLTFNENVAYKVDGKELNETLTYQVTVPFKSDEVPSCTRLPEVRYSFV